jgi:hypothetical protein
MGNTTSRARTASRSVWRWATWASNDSKERTIMKKISIVFALALVGLLTFGATGCLEKKVIEIVVTGETCADFFQDSASQSFTDTVVVDYAKEVEGALRDAELSRSDIVGAKFVSASYEVTSFTSPGHDWVISGSIDVERKDIVSTSSTIITYTSQSVQKALHKKINATLVGAGVDVINQALSDFIDGVDPVLEFTVDNGSVTPSPSDQDRIIFNWRACIVIHVIVEDSVELPDPF